MNRVTIKAMSDTLQEIAEIVEAVRDMKARARSGAATPPAKDDSNSTLDYNRSQGVVEAATALCEEMERDGYQNAKREAVSTLRKALSHDAQGVELSPVHAATAYHELQMKAAAMVEVIRKMDSVLAAYLDHWETYDECGYLGVPTYDATVGARTIAAPFIERGE